MADETTTEETFTGDSSLDIDTSTLTEEVSLGAETEDAGPVDPYAAYGGKDVVDKAHGLYQSIQTEDGVWNMFFEAGRALGLGVREIEALFQGSEEPEQELMPEPADDDVMTFGQFKHLMQEQIIAPQAEREQRQAEAVAKNTIDTTLGGLGIADPEIREAILQLGDRYLGEDISPGAVRSAVERGHADYLKLVAAERKAYVEQKRAQGETVPKAPAGGVPVVQAGAASEPQDVREAIRRARDRMAAGV